MYSSCLSRELKRYLTVVVEDASLGSTWFTVATDTLASESPCGVSVYCSLVPYVVSRTNTCTYISATRVNEPNMVNTQEEPSAYTRIGVSSDVRNVNSIMVMLDTPMTVGWQVSCVCKKATGPIDP